MFTDVNVQVCSTRPVLRAKENGERCADWTDSSLIKYSPGGGETSLLESFAALSCRYSLGCCSSAKERGSDGAEDRLGRRTLSHLLRQSQPQVQAEKGRVEGVFLWRQLTERQESGVGVGGGVE